MNDKKTRSGWRNAAQGLGEVCVCVWVCFVSLGVFFFFPFWPYCIPAESLT